MEAFPKILLAQKLHSQDIIDLSIETSEVSLVLSKLKEKDALPCRDNGTLDSEFNCRAFLVMTLNRIEACKFKARLDCTRIASKHTKTRAELDSHSLQTSSLLRAT